VLGVLASRVAGDAVSEQATDRDWTKRLAREATPVEISECLGDLLDRAEFAEEIARRRILERLVEALSQQPFSSLRWLEAL
jgi:hypothetical protein